LPVPEPSGFGTGPGVEGSLITHWPDMLRVAGSLVTNQVRAYDLLRMFGREGRPTPLGQAFAEYGRIAKTSPWSTRSTTPTVAR
jgi:TnpA family transposase